MNQCFENIRWVAGTVLLTVAACFGPIVVAQSAGALDPPAIKTGLLPEAATGQVKLSDYAPAVPYAERTPGLFARMLFKSDAGKDFRVEVLDLLVAPAPKPVPLRFDGSAVVEVRLGEGTLHRRGTPEAFKTGATLQVQQADQGAAVENRSAAPVLLRAYVITAR